jgi:hypothetical protein
MAPKKNREVVKFVPNVPVEVALKYPIPGKIVSTPSGERMMYTLVDGRVMFLDLPVAKKVDELGVNVQETFFVSRPPTSQPKTTPWGVWLSPETEKARANAAAPQPAEETPNPAEVAPEETLLERQLKASIELVKQGKLGELGNGMFAVDAGTSAATPAPEGSNDLKGHHRSNNGNGTTNGVNGKNGNGDANGNGPVPLLVHPFTAWAEALLCQTDALIDVYAAALHNASTKHGNQVKPEDVRSLLVTVFIQRSKGVPYAA